MKWPVSHSHLPYSLQQFFFFSFYMSLNTFSLSFTGFALDVYIFPSILSFLLFFSFSPLGKSFNPHISNTLFFYVNSFYLVLYFSYFPIFLSFVFLFLFLCISNLSLSSQAPSSIILISILYSPPPFPYRSLLFIILVCVCVSFLFFTFGKSLHTSALSFHF